METKAVNIPSEIFEKIEKRVDATEFNSVDEYVVYVLNQVLEKIEEENQPEETYSTEDEEKVKERLRALGYIE